MRSKKPLVAIVMGSISDLKTIKPAVLLLKKFKVPIETKIVSAHRTPSFMKTYSESAEKRGIQVIIAGAGGAAHLPGMVASFTSLPIIGIPVISKKLKGLDSLLSVVQMPKGVPVATVAIDNSFNAALLALRILSLKDKSIKKKYKQFQAKQTKISLKSNTSLKKLLK